MATILFFVPTQSGKGRNKLSPGHSHSRTVCDARIGEIQRYLAKKKYQKQYHWCKPHFLFMLHLFK